MPIVTLYPASVGSGAVPISINSSAAAALAQSELDLIPASLKGAPGEPRLFGASLQGSGGILLFSGDTAQSATVSGYPVLLSNATAPTSIVDASILPDTVISGTGGLSYFQAFPTVVGSAIVSGGGDSFVDLAYGANTVSLDITPSAHISGSVTTFGGSATIGAAAGGALVIVNAAVNTGAVQDVAHIGAGGHDTVEVSGNAVVALFDNTNVLSVLDGGEAFFGNAATTGGASFVSLGNGVETVGALSGSSLEFTGSAASSLGGSAGTIFIAGGTPDDLSGVWGDQLVVPVSQNVVVQAGAGATTLLGAGDIASPIASGSDTVMGGAGFFHAGTGGNSLLISSNITPDTVETMLEGGGPGDILVAASQSGRTSLLGAAGTELMTADGVTIAAGNVAIMPGAPTLAASIGDAQAAHASQGLATINAGPASALIFGEPSGGDLIESGTGSSTVYGHTGTVPGAREFYEVGTPGGTLVIADFNAVDTFRLTNGETVANTLAGSAGITFSELYPGLPVGNAPTGLTSETVTLSDNTTIVFFNAAVVQSNGQLLAAAECFLEGTHLHTPAGPVAVEALRAGDLVLAMEEQAAVARGVVWVGRRALSCSRYPEPSLVWPVRIHAGAFGPGRPERDLLLSPDHAVFVAGVFIPVRHLINGTSIAREPRDHVVYYHVELPEHGIVLAEGLPVESWLDTGNRSAFAGDGAMVMDGDPAFAAWAREAGGHAPLVVTGEKLAAARRLVRENAGPDRDRRRAA